MATINKKFLIRDIPEDLLHDFKAGCASQGKSMNNALKELMELHAHHRLVLVPQDMLEALMETRSILGNKLLTKEIKDPDNLVSDLHKKINRILRRLGDE